MHETTHPFIVVLCVCVHVFEVIYKITRYHLASSDLTGGGELQVTVV